MEAVILAVIAVIAAVNLALILHIVPNVKALAGELEVGLRQRDDELAAWHKALGQEIAALTVELRLATRKKVRTTHPKTGRFVWRYPDDTE